MSHRRQPSNPRGGHYQCGECPFATADPSHIEWHYTTENHRAPAGTPVGHIGNPGMSKLHRFKGKDGEELRYAYFGLPEYDVTVNRKKQTTVQQPQPHQRERQVITSEQEEQITAQITPRGSSRAHRRHRRIQNQTESRGNH